MLRIECDCGKILKVDDALVGKKVKCPGCGELMVVKKPGAAVSAKPLPAARKRVADEDDGEEEAPRKKKKAAAAKGGSGLLLLLLGGGALFLLLLVAVAGVGAWFLFLKPE